MDNKIKIAFFLLISFVLSACVGWLENDNFYERPLNNWASVRYFSNQGYQEKDFPIYFSFTNTVLNNKRIDLDFNYERTPAIIKGCINTIYNNDYILAQNKRNENDSSYLLIDSYYKITPTFSNDNITPDNYLIDTISKSDFDILVKNCRDCQELNADKIRQLDYELDHGDFPTKTVIFFSLIFLYVFYKIYKKKKRK